MSQIKNISPDYAKAMRMGMAVLNFNQGGFAESLGLSDKYIGQCLNKKRKPSIIQLEKMALKLDMKLSEFIAWGEE